MLEGPRMYASASQGASRIVNHHLKLREQLLLLDISKETTLLISWLLAFKTGKRLIPVVLSHLVCGIYFAWQLWKLIYLTELYTDLLFWWAHVDQTWKAGNSMYSYCFNKTLVWWNLVWNSIWIASLKKFRDAYINEVSGLVILIRWTLKADW